MEKQIVEIDKIISDKNGEIVIVGCHLRPSMRKNSGKYVYGPKARYTGCPPVVFLGDQYKFEVEPIYNKKYGTQYKIISAVRKNPVSCAQIEKFLMKNIKSMTRKRLKEIMTRYKDDTLQAIQKDPHAFDFAGINPQDGEELHTLLNKAAAYEDTLLQLQINELDCRFAYPLFRKYGTSALFIIKTTPYQPYMERIYDFRTADKLYLNHGSQADGLPRCMAVMRAAMQNDVEGNGNLFIPRKQLEGKMAAFLKKEANVNSEYLLFARGTIDETIEQLRILGAIAVDSSFGEENIYLNSSYDMETTAAENITRIWQGEKRLDCDRAGIETFLEGFEISHGYALTSEQEQAVFTALTSPVSIISGGPGTGKIRTIRAIIDTIQAVHPTAEIRLCAPTGRAAVRIEEMTGVPAATIHRMLGLGEYNKNAVKPGALDCDYLIADEFSMVDIGLCKELFLALNSHARIIIIGDYNQLPSVGPGLVLRGLIHVDIFPTQNLTQVFRQAGHTRIIENANSIMLPPDPNRRLQIASPNQPGEDFYFLESDDPRCILELIEMVVEKATGEYGVPPDAMQVLSPVHVGDLGTNEINARLQKKLNPSTKYIEHYAHIRYVFE